MADTQLPTVKRSFPTSKKKLGRPRTHGLRASGLPKGCLYLESQLAAFRRLLSDELAARQGERGVMAEALIQSAVRHETRALLCGRWLRLECEKLNVDQRVTLLREIGRATTARDTCLKGLGFDSDKQSALMLALYGSRADDASNAVLEGSVEVSDDGSN